MRLHNVTMLNTGKKVSIVIKDQKIQDTGSRYTAAMNIDLSGAMAFPGLINSHDHLDFNCFAPLGDKIYNNYTEWGNHIHTVYRDEIDQVLAIPLSLRTSWGMYKNLLAGVTTVVNHGAFLKIENPLLNVYQQVQNLHSVKFQKNWRWKLNNPILRGRTCVIHAGEGTDQSSSTEIDELIKWNLLERKIVAIHGVAMNTVQAQQFAGLVWCPESNQVLLNRHADIFQLKEHVKILFGTDSTLTGDWNIWKHLRVARQVLTADDASLFAMLNAVPAAIWRLNTGEIKAGKDADIVVAAAKNAGAGWDHFFSINPSDILLILHKGKPRLFDISLLPQLINHIDITRYTQVSVGNAKKLVEGNLPELVNAIKKCHPGVKLPADISVNDHTLSPV